MALLFLLVSMSCERTDQALVLLLVSVCCEHTDQALVLLLVSVCCTTAVSQGGVSLNDCMRSRDTQDQRQVPAAGSILLAPPQGLGLVA